MQLLSYFSKHFSRLDATSRINNLVNLELWTKMQVIKRGISPSFEAWRENSTWGWWYGLSYTIKSGGPSGSDDSHGWYLVACRPFVRWAMSVYVVCTSVWFWKWFTKQRLMSLLHFSDHHLIVILTSPWLIFPKWVTLHWGKTFLNDCAKNYGKVTIFLAR